MSCKKFVNSLAQSCFGQTDHDQRGQAVGPVDFDSDSGSIHAHLGAAMDDGEGYGRSLS